MQRQWRGRPPHRGYWRGKPAMNGFWFPGRLVTETTRDLFDSNRFRVKDSNIDYVIGKQFEKYIQQSTHSKRWKELAYKWLIKRYEYSQFYDYIPILESHIQDLKKEKQNEKRENQGRVCH